ncbi:MAG: hypothetical protein KKG21_05480, partial [Candidatus Omnitrophica bacterium]|nr:hypothetical protein [Candidatus Omnitrophota bacterium]
MLKIRKALTTKIIATIIVATFLFSNSAYSTPPDSPDTLRTQLDSPETDQRLREAAIELFLERYNLRRILSQEQALDWLRKSDVQQISSVSIKKEVPVKVFSIDDARDLVTDGEASIAEREDGTMIIVPDPSIEGHFALGDEGEIGGVTYETEQGEIISRVFDAAPEFDFALAGSIQDRYEQGSVILESEGKIAAAVLRVKTLLGEVEDTESTPIEKLVEKVEQGNVFALVALRLTGRAMFWGGKKKQKDSSGETKGPPRGLLSRFKSISDEYYRVGSKAAKLEFQLRKKGLRGKELERAIDAETGIEDIMAERNKVLGELEEYNGDWRSWDLSQRPKPGGHPNACLETLLTAMFVDDTGEAKAFKDSVFRTRDVRRVRKAAAEMKQTTVGLELRYLVGMGILRRIERGYYEFAEFTDKQLAFIRTIAIGSTTPAL